MHSHTNIIKENKKNINVNNSQYSLILAIYTVSQKKHVTTFFAIT